MDGYRITKLKTTKAFLTLGGCSETLIHVLDRRVGQVLPTEEKATLPFVGGIKQHGYQCGMLWGAALSAGAHAFQQKGPGSDSEYLALAATQKLLETFEEDNGEINCYEITEINRESTAMQMAVYFLFKGGSIGCIKMANRFAPKAEAILLNMLEETPNPRPTAPVSCTSEMAKQLQATEQHATMVVGLAGGLGLSGGACGAFGTALWLSAMKFQALDREINLWDDPVFNSFFEELMEGFLRASDFKYECSEITGKKFETPEEHASYCQRGGCSSLIRELAKFAQQKLDNLESENTAV